ncbi:MAG: FtsX-like permease family protein, partial [Cyclobacteriaceae bacterium]
STVFQFVSAIVLIVWLFSVSTQVEFVTKDTWGIDRNRVVVIEIPLGIDTKEYSVEINSLKNELSFIRGMEDITWSTTVAGDLFENPINFSRTDTTGFWSVSKSNGGVDARFIPFYGLKLISGRNFLPDHPADRRSVILSRLAAKSIGLEPENAIGKTVSVGKHPWRPFQTNAEIIGVIEDHRYTPLYLETGIADANRGTILTYGDYLFAKNKPLKMSLRIKGQNIAEIIDRIEKQYRQVFPGQIFHWYFLDDHMNAHYKNENIARNQILLFTCIAIGIACLGLLGMISNKVVQKTKEIGIRKVLGAELHQIAHVLLNTTIKQAILATVIGIPVSFYLTVQYLQKFSERITLQWWHFALPVVILMTILLVTISSVLWKATRTNPVDSLRYE